MVVVGAEREGLSPAGDCPSVSSDGVSVCFLGRVLESRGLPSSREHSVALVPFQRGGWLFVLALLRFNWVDFPFRGKMEFSHK